MHENEISNLRLGLLLNFHADVLKDGITRVVNDLTDQDVPVGINALDEVQI